MSNYRSVREEKRGTMLVVVLGLLVALFVIGTSFSFVTLSERRAAANYLDRQRALDLALDGVEYSVARLRAESTREWYNGIGPGTAGLDGDSPLYDPELYSQRPLDGPDPAVSWPKSQSITNSSGAKDVNWVDFDGNGSRGGDENQYGSDKGTANFAPYVTGFHNDGFNVNQVRNKFVERSSDGYGPSGTYEELGDYFRVRVIDAAALLNVNNYRTKDELSQALLVLGDAIDAWLNNGKPSGGDNPFPPELVQDFVDLAEDVAFFFTSKEQLRPIWARFEGGAEMYELAMNFITVNSWRDPKYRDYVQENMKVEEDDPTNPLNLEQVRLQREGFSRTDGAGVGAGTGAGRDGWPDWKPNASGFAKSPVNVNTAPKPVLVALLANISANARLLWFDEHSDITDDDQLIFDKHGVSVPIQSSGTTDFGRQNNRADIGGTGIKEESQWYPNGADNRAIFQLVPIGPIGTTFGKRGATSSNSSSTGDHASALADEIIRLRSQHAFTSWQDFDARFCRNILLGLQSDRSSVVIPDHVGVTRTTLNRTSNDLASSYPSLLPDPANVQHPTNPIGGGDASMSPSDFRAWYWKSCVDMIRAALCPSNMTARYNADYPYQMNVDRMDLTNTNGPICFSSMGIYEVVSQGEILAPGDEDANATSSNPANRLPVARRKVRTVVQIYEVLRHSSQYDFMAPLDPSVVNQNATSSTPTGVETLASHSKKFTKSGPHSIDEISNGSWQDNTSAESSYLADRDDAKGISYEPAVQGGGPARDRIKGHNEWTAASSDFGWVTMDPQDETAFPELDVTNNFLTFHARYNESLWGRTKSTAYPNLKIDGANSDQIGLDANWGHKPWVKEAIFDDFISSATPRSTEQSIQGASGAKEFENADKGDEATKYSSLQPDGVYLWGGHLRPRSNRTDSALIGTYGQRGLQRVARLKILRYPCGSRNSFNPFEPIRPFAWIGDTGAGNRDDGVDDATQVGYVAPTAAPDEIQARIRLGVHPNTPQIGGAYRGTDNHNKNAEDHRQRLSNMPYYEGTVDFWIKWDLPAQGSDVNNQVAALGEVDPASHNFSGLFGATAYGRFVDSAQTNINTAAGTGRDQTCDFEGVQFYVYKEPGGWLRFTRLYFSEAFGANVINSATSSVPSTIGPFGIAMRRILDATNPPTSYFSGYTGTNDICNDIDNKGFLYARTDAWLDISNATYANSSERIILRAHDWHRFTLSYNSNTNQPYRLWFDGRRVSGVAFQDDPDGLKGYRNDGRHSPNTDQQIPEEDPSEPTYAIYRTTNKLLEINPEDRLTIGCIFRRQLDLTTPQVYGAYYDTDNNPDAGVVDKPPRPVFKFDANFVAVANATIDDFRITWQQLPQGQQDITESDFAVGSRYGSPTGGNDIYFEQGFLPIRAQDNQLHALPVRLGTISWTELRPDWDPYRNRGMNLATSSGIEMEWAVIDDYATLQTGGAVHDFANAEFSGISGRNTSEGVGDNDYWAAGGMSLEGAKLPSGSQVGVFLYRAHFRIGDDIQNVNNVTPYLLDVTITVLTPPRKLAFVIEY